MPHAIFKLVIALKSSWDQRESSTVSSVGDPDKIHSGGQSIEMDVESTKMGKSSIETD